MKNKETNIDPKEKKQKSNDQVEEFQKEEHVKERNEPVQCSD